MKKLIALLLACAMLLGVLAGCGNQQPTETTQAPTEAGDPNETQAAIQETEAPESETPLKLEWRQSIGIDTLFESPAKDQASLYPYMVFDCLMYWYGAEGEFVPALATEWGNNEDYTEFTLTIREGVKWHDGEILDAEDVAFTILYSIANPNSSTAKKYQYVEGYEALKNGETDELAGMTVDGNTITFKLTKSRPLFLTDIYATYVLPEHLLGDIPWAEIDSSDYWKKPVGCGAYIIDEVNFPDYFTCTRFNEYWGEPAGIKNVQFISYQTGGSDAAVAGMINGEIDFGTRHLITDSSIAANMTAQNSDLKTLPVNAHNVRCFVFNLDHRADNKLKEDLQKKEVRQAFDLLLDQEVIASFYGTQAIASATLVNPNATEYNTDIPYVSKDVEAAKKLLDEAGFDYSQTIDIAYYYTDQTTLDIMAMIVQDFAAAGVTVNPILLEGDLADLIYTTCNYDLIYLAGANSDFDQSAFYFQCTSWGTYTFMGQLDERTAMFDDLMNAYNTTNDSAERKDLSWQMQALNYEYAYMLPAYVSNFNVVYNAVSVQVPEDCLTGGGQYYNWSQWEMLK